MFQVPGKYSTCAVVLLTAASISACSDSGDSSSNTANTTAGVVEDNPGSTTGSGTTDAGSAGNGSTDNGEVNNGGTDNNTPSNNPTVNEGTDGNGENGDAQTSAGNVPDETNTGTENTDGGTTDGNGNPTDTGNEGTTQGTDNTVVNTTPASPGTDAAAIAFIENAEKISAGDDDSPSRTESLSLVGPFLKDPSRADGPPSTPQDLTLLMSGENWVEFSWIPSVDDQSVQSYEIQRDGTPVYTITGNGNYEFDYRSWITTSYIDCNYTRYTFCDENAIVPGSSYEYRVVAIDNEGMRSAPSAPAVFQLAQRQSGPVDLSGYTKVFEDEFDGDSLDRTYWKTALPWGPDETVNGELQYFANMFGSNPPPVNPFVFTGSTLKITGSVTPPEMAAFTDKPYISGVLSTKDKFKMTYGYVEMSAKVAGGEGLLSTFYLFNQDFEKNQPEIDIMEYIGGRPNKSYQTYHYYDSLRARYGTGERHSTPTMETVLSENLSAAFHTYGVLWEPELVVWYIDGVEVRRLIGPRVSDEPMNIITQLVIGSEWIGEPDPAALPNSLEIDYIRAWQKQ